MGLFDLFKKRDLKVNNSNVSNSISKDEKTETNQLEVKRAKYTYKDKNYLSTDGIEEEI